MNRRIVVLVMVLFVIAGEAGVNHDAIAREVYLSQVGNDTTGNGSADNPWRTIGYALQQQAGEEDFLIHMQNGIYAEDSFPIILQSNIELRGVDRDSVIIDAGSTLDAERRAIEAHEKSGIKIRFLTIRNGYLYPEEAIGGGIYLEGCSNIEISNVVFRQCGASSGGGVAALGCEFVKIDSCLFTEMMDESELREFWGYGVAFYDVIDGKVMHSAFTGNEIAGTPGPFENHFGLFHAGAMYVKRSERIESSYNEIGDNLLEIGVCSATGFRADSSRLILVRGNRFTEEEVSTNNIGPLSVYLQCERSLMTDNIWTGISQFCESVNSPRLIESIGSRTIVDGNTFSGDSLDGGARLLDMMPNTPGLVIRNNFHGNFCFYTIATLPYGPQDSLLIGGVEGFGNNITGFYHFMIRSDRVARYNASWNYFGEMSPYRAVFPIQPDGIQITPFAVDTVEFSVETVYLGPNPVECGVVANGDSSKGDIYIWSLTRDFDDTLFAEVSLLHGERFHVPIGQAIVGFADCIAMRVLFIPDEAGVFTDSVIVTWDDQLRYIPVFGGREFNSVGNNSDGTTSKPNSYSFIAYPTPFNSSLFISYSSPTNAPLLISLVDLSGRTLQQNWVPGTSFGKGVATIGTTALPSGNYFVIIGGKEKGVVMPVRCLK